MRMRLAVLFASVLLIAAAPIDRWLVENGIDDTRTNGATNASIVLLSGFGTSESVRLRPATCVGGSCTRVAPSLGTEGMHLEDVESCRMMVCAPSGQTLTGTGTMEAWIWDPVISSPGNLTTKNVAVTKNGDPCQSFAVEVMGMSGANVRLTYRAVGVGISMGGGGGGVLTVSMLCCKMARKGGCAP